VSGAFPLLNESGSGEQDAWFQTGVDGERGLQNS
jgi:hypothetical protein